MASETAHFLVGAALALPAAKSRALNAILPSTLLPIAAGALATTPDLDLAWRRIFGPLGGPIMAHRGLLHSPFFLILASGALAAAVAWNSQKAFARLWFVLAGCMWTHPLLDAMTTGGRGVMLLLPLTRHRYYLPWRLIQTPGMNESLFRRAFLLRPSEMPFCIAAAIIGIVWLWALTRREESASRSADNSLPASFRSDRP